MILIPQTTKRIALYILLSIYSFPIYADDLANQYDCPIIVPEFDDTALLTRAERIEKMDQALDDALNRVRECRLLNTSSSNPSSSQNNSQPSMPSDELSGTEPEPSGSNQPPPATTQPSGSMAGTQPPPKETISAEEKPVADTPSAKTAGKPMTGTPSAKQTITNGKLPEDIPPANNDDVVAKQIREAAIGEQDPQKQAKLWNEYRRYKGLSEK